MNASILRARAHSTHVSTLFCPTKIVFDVASQCITFSMYLFYLEVSFSFCKAIFFVSLSLSLSIYSIPCVSIEIIIVFTKLFTCLFSFHEWTTQRHPLDGFLCFETPDNYRIWDLPMNLITALQTMRKHTHTQNLIQIDTKKTYKYTHKNTRITHTITPFLYRSCAFNTNNRTVFISVLVLKSLQFSFRDHII